MEGGGEILDDFTFEGEGELSDFAFEGKLVGESDALDLDGEGEGEGEGEGDGVGVGDGDGGEIEANVGEGEGEGEEELKVNPIEEVEGGIECETDEEPNVEIE